MSLAKKGELALVKEIRARFSARVPRGVVGVGDDAAVYPPMKGRMLASTDMMVEGVHFDTACITPRQLGRKLVAVNASDIYAMGGSPKYFLLSLALPPSTEIKFVNALFNGVEDGLSAHGASLTGGDLSASISGISLSATVLGQARRPVSRSGARPGDGIYVTGTLGDSACGLALLQKIRRPVQMSKGFRGGPLAWKVMGPLLGRHLEPEPKPLARGMLKDVSAMMDLSDGLLMDLWRLCGDSGVGALVDEASLPMSAEMVEAAGHLGLDPMRLALSGGEDYLLLFTAPAGLRRRGVFEIGGIVEKGFRISGPDGRTRAFRPEGYGHFA